MNASSLVFTHVSGNTADNIINSSSQVNQADGDGRYNIVFQFGPGAADPGLSGGATSVYLITSSHRPITEGQFDFLSAPAGGHGPFVTAAHVQNTIGPEGSGWIGTEGPEPQEPPVIPLPLPALGGLVLMGGMGVTRAIRRRNA